MMVVVRVGGVRGRVVVRVERGRGRAVVRRKGRVVVRVGGEKRKESLSVEAIPHSRWYCWSFSQEWAPGEELVHHS